MSLNQPLVDHLFCDLRHGEFYCRDACDSPGYTLESAKSDARTEKMRVVYDGLSASDLVGLEVGSRSLLAGNEHQCDDQPTEGGLEQTMIHGCVLPPEPGHRCRAVSRKAVRMRGHTFVLDPGYSPRVG